MKRYISILILFLAGVPLWGQEINGIANQLITSVQFGESLALSNPVTGHSGLVHLKFPHAWTITEVCASTDTGTATIQFDERVATTPNTGGTDVMTAQLVADSDEQCTASFTNAAIAADALLNLDIDVVASSPTQLRIHVTYTRTL